MFGGHFYHETIRRAVSVFGTLFNSINVVRRNGSGEVLNIVKVPLAYGPRQKFLSRIEQQSNLTDPKVAIKLPRMSFEITSLTYDTNTKMQKGLRQTLKGQGADPLNRTTVLGPVGYRMGMQLNIMAKNQDDALQIIEQILPFFQPDYTVTVKQVDNNFKTDMPFVLQGINIADDYEGDYITRRAIIYTLDFETRVRFYGEISSKSVIRKTITDIRNQNNSTLQERQIQIVNPFLASEDEDYSIDVNYSFANTPDEIQVEVSDASDFEVGGIITGSTTLTSGQIISKSGNTIVVYKPDGRLEISENVSISDTINTTVLSTNEVYYE